MKLHLHVKTEYFEAFRAGNKNLEYRKANRYWADRLLYRESGYYEGIVYYNAYKAGPENKIEMPWNGWELQTITHKHFGTEPILVFAIRLSASVQSNAKDQRTPAGEVRTNEIMGRTTKASPRNHVFSRQFQAVTAEKLEVN